MKGILFKEKLFLQTIAGKKTETRRIIPMDIDCLGSFRLLLHGYSPAVPYHYLGISGKDASGEDRIWTFRVRYMPDETVYLKEPWVVDCDNSIVYQYGNKMLDGLVFKVKFNNKLFMPEKYSRYKILITKIKVERLDMITNAGAIREGIKSHIPVPGDGEANPRMQFMNLWNEINGNPKPVYKKINGKNVLQHYISYPSTLHDQDRRKTIRGVDHICYPNPFVFVYSYKLLKKELKTYAIYLRGGQIIRLKAYGYRYEVQAFSSLSGQWGKDKTIGRISFFVDYTNKQGEKGRSKTHDYHYFKFDDVSAIVREDA